ncbi:helix-turn-helix transcriptional regulator [Tateyamaria omphalii]|uniref:HTH araC/xylS-type domain-containing protein n=1 Tax=Tateyamaria omphalii TaxID=299262 RepID=A0A1P8MR90_9RHOB|nr:helix-turn-helix transcriptional regulator [Tateyamaria omphalii]APX10596.1 hypothetical protein BWR18_01950 [Tateyamaria omphalii]
MISAVEMLAISAAVAFPVRQGSMIAFAIELAEVPLTMCKPLLLCLYVQRLTHDPTQEMPHHRRPWHGLPVALYMYILPLPAPLKAGLHPGAHDRVGVRFFDCVNHWRIKDAADKLRHTDATIPEIAYAVGFNPRSSFYTAAKRELGMTPSQYRKGA